MKGSRLALLMPQPDTQVTAVVRLGAKAAHLPNRGFLHYVSQLFISPYCLFIRKSVKLLNFKSTVLSKHCALNAALSLSQIQWSRRDRQKLSSTFYAVVSLYCFILRSHLCLFFLHKQSYILITAWGVFLFFVKTYQGTLDTVK